ncbi:hypothetical protein ANCDUO_25930 [Ancylostoma duodenale]|uniref:SCP domain-containing protein n=1 Tax=Ancylostoma duodenale TaxID=51022 RepID=A0A0C2FGH2_9BILA|nr:hypothetical protein ANCDUO_25930 [Ancylostoma duodenale]
MCEKEKLRGTGMTDKTRMTFLNLHNDLRKQTFYSLAHIRDVEVKFRSVVASGKAEDKTVKGGFAPKAANMRKLVATL